MNKHGAIAVRLFETDEVTLHAAADPGGGYDTLCGLGGISDRDIGEEVEAPVFARINCSACHSLWKTARAFKASDFATNLKD